MRHDYPHRSLRQVWGETIPERLESMRQTPSFEEAMVMKIYDLAKLASYRFTGFIMLRKSAILRETTSALPRMSVLPSSSHSCSAACSKDNPTTSFKTLPARRATQSAVAHIGTLPRRRIEIPSSRTWIASSRTLDMIQGANDGCA